MVWSSVPLDRERRVTVAAHLPIDKRPFKGLAHLFVPLAPVGVGAAGALMAPVRCHDCRTGLPRERGPP